MTLMCFQTHHKRNWQTPFISNNRQAFLYTFFTLSFHHFLRCILKLMYCGKMESSTPTFSMFLLLLAATASSFCGYLLQSQWYAIVVDIFSSWTSLHTQHAQNIYTVVTLAEANHHYHSQYHLLMHKYQMGYPFYLQSASHHSGALQLSNVCFIQLALLVVIAQAYVIFTIVVSFDYSSVCSCYFLFHNMLMPYLAQTMDC